MDFHAFMPYPPMNWAAMTMIDGSWVGVGSVTIVRKGRLLLRVRIIVSAISWRAGDTAVTST